MGLLDTFDYPTLPLFPLVGLKRRKVMFYVPLTVATLSFDALIDTGACLRATSLSLFDKIKKHSPDNILICNDKPSFHIQVANGDNCNVLFKTIISFELGGQPFNDEFLVLEKTNTPLLGLPFFIYNQIDSLTSKGRLQLPNMTYQLNTMRKPLTKECPEKIKQPSKLIGLYTRRKTVLKPYMMEVLECIPHDDWKDVNLTGVVEPLKIIERELNLCITNAFSTLEIGVLVVGAMNLNETDFMLPDGLKIANLAVISLEQAKFLAPVDPNLCRYLERSHPG